MDRQELILRIEAAMNNRYGDTPFETPELQAEITRDLQLLSAVFPELDITAVVMDDPPHAISLSSRAHAWLRKNFFNV